MNIRYFNLAKSASEFSDFPRVKIGCVIIYKNKVLGIGYNICKENPIQKLYNKERGFDVDSCVNSLHAEMMAIMKVRNLDIQWSKAHIYIYRELKDGSLALSKPCAACTKAIIDLGIKNIHYTGNNKYISEVWK